MIVSNKKNIKVYEDLVYNQCLNGHGSEISALEFKADKSLIISGSLDWDIRVWKLNE